MPFNYIIERRTSWSRLIPWYFTVYAAEMRARGFVGALIVPLQKNLNKDFQIANNSGLEYYVGKTPSA